METKSIEKLCFLGYKRKFGNPGIRNYVLVIATSNCAASVVRQISLFSDYDQLDGIVPIIYGGGCAIKTGGNQAILLNSLLSNHVDHPNVVGALFVSLGCEEITGRTIIKQVNDTSKIIGSISIQNNGGYKKTIESGINQIQNFIKTWKKPKREIFPISSLMIALECGGSDENSGITANPELGKVSERLVNEGGTVVLSEFPECPFDILMKKCGEKKDLQNKLLQIKTEWDSRKHHYSIDFEDNLSPGNKIGGLQNVQNKQYGAIKKVGNLYFTDILKYGQKPKKYGGCLFMDTPGYDPMSVTGMVAAGCQLCCFTTGRGSVYNNSICPTIKISSNAKVAERMIDVFDVVCDIDKTKDKSNILHKILETANGKKTKGEINKVGQDEFVLWMDGEFL